MRDNQQFYIQKIVWSQPPLESTLVGARISDAETPYIDSTPIGANMSKSKTPTTDSSARRVKSQKSTYQRTWSQTQVHQVHHRLNLICMTTESIKENML